MCTVLMALLMLLARLFYPTYPEYNICNNALNWDSVLKELESWEVGGSYTLLVSHANPNSDGIFRGNWRFDGGYMGLRCAL